ncbi:HEPN domain-containing protein [Candidatus Woesearchaeota archaeon]|nr:HEPN domain-containing protein [Candidatus Woesearchaeota archaeon]
MKEEMSKWFRQAKEDFDTANVNLDNKKYYAAVQFCQQCLEKALKALWLKEKKKEFPYIHDLTFFMKRLNLPENFENICKDLTSAYAETRYPSDVIPSEKFSKDDADEILEKTKEVLEWIQKRI